MCCSLPWQAILATIKGLEGRVRLSKRLLQRAILHFYTEKRLFPPGVVAEMDSAQEWALKMGKAIKRLVLWQCELFHCVFIVVWVPNQFQYNYIYVLSMNPWNSCKESDKSFHGSGDGLIPKNKTNVVVVLHIKHQYIYRSYVCLRLEDFDVFSNGP